jgi:hypothetical protein
MRFAWALCASVVIAGAIFAQDSDPLAPLDPGTTEPSSSKPDATQPTVTPPAATQLAPLPPRPLVIPKDWRGVLLAIGNGEWEAARLGIERLPEGPLKPYPR